MVKMPQALIGLSEQPGYAIMRGLARFQIVREVVSGARRLADGGSHRAFVEKCERQLENTLFPNVDKRAFLERLMLDGVSFGLKLPPEMTAEIRDYADTTPCYADRNTNFGFIHSDRSRADERLGKPVLLAQYFNTAKDCPAVAKLVGDPLLCWVAAHYLGAVPVFVGTNVWWTFPVKASEADRSQHAHHYHRDVDDFRFFKFFFYLTDVEADEGAHVVVLRSHYNPPLIRRGDRFKIRRYSDAEIEGHYNAEHIKEICGPAGVGFAENTLCIHKGSTPKSEPRLLLQLQYALFDYGVMNDERDPSVLKTL